MFRLCRRAFRLNQLKQIFCVTALLTASAISVANAQSYVVVATCGTPPATPPVGSANGPITIDQQGRLCANTGSGGAAGSGNAGYPSGATPVTAAQVGTTGGTSVTLPGVAGKFTYICGYTVSPGSATAAITILVSVTGISPNQATYVGAPVTAVGVTGAVLLQQFNPCIPGSALNTGVSVNAGALGAGGVNQAINAWGYQQ